MTLRIKLKLSPKSDAMLLDVKKGTKIENIMLNYKGQYKYPVLLAKKDNEIVELTDKIYEECEITMLDMTYPSVEFAYQRSLSLLYLKSIYDVLGEDDVVLGNSLNKGIYTEIKIGRPVTDEEISEIVSRMAELTKMDLPIEKEITEIDEAVDFLESIGQKRRTELLKNMKGNSEICFYSIDGFKDFFYGSMVPSTGYLELFDVRKYKNGVLLRYPHRDSPDKIPEYKNEYMMYEAFREAARWRNIIGLRYVNDLNGKIRAGKGKELIMLFEALQEKRVAQLADTILKEKKRIILIAGPSSSGKTTFAQRLCIQLKVNGMSPIYLGTDDFFLERSQTPKDEDGKYDFENLRALDIDLFNRDMNALLAGETVDLPIFDFVEGKKIFGKRITKAYPGQPIVIEGIHGLNEKLTENIDSDEKFKIYISPLTTLGIDVHNRIPTTDSRLLRRIVRDNKFRGKSAKATLSEWYKLRDGEKKNIFPFSGEADAFFNSNHSYEITILKKYAQPLLEEIGKDEPEYAEARRLLEFLRFFDVMEDDSAVANNSILREFIGGSVIV